MILRLLLMFWKPIAALLAAIGLYGKGRVDQNRKAKAKAADDRIETMKEVQGNVSDAQKQSDDDLIRRLSQRP